MNRHYLNQWWPSLLTHIYITQPGWVVIPFRASMKLWTLTQVKAFCLIAPSNYLNHCRLIINQILWHSIMNHFADHYIHHMMMSSNGNIFHITGPLWGESTSHWWTPLTKGQWHGALMFSLICAWTNGWENNRDAGDLRRHHVHYEVTVMTGP